MTRLVFLTILLSVTITAIAQVVLKAGMNGAVAQKAVAAGLSVRSVLAVATEPLVFGGLVLYFLAAAVWLIVLSKVDVSLAYPFVALGFVLTAIMGRLFFEETLSLARIAGIVLISGGVVLLARS